MARNKLLRRTLEWATVEWLKDRAGLRSEWDQSEWFARPDLDSACGTVCCIAGKVALDTGHQIEFDENYDTFVINDVRLADGHPNQMAFEEVGRDELKISSREASDLFNQYRSIFELWRIAERISNGKVRIPEWLVPAAVAEVHRLDQVRDLDPTVEFEDE